MGPSITFFQGGAVWKEIELLEDHSDRCALLRSLVLLELVEFVARAPVPDPFPLDPQLTAVDLFQVVHTTEEGALSRTGRPQQTRDLACIDIQADAFEDLKMAERLADVPRPYDWFLHLTFSSSSADPLGIAKEALDAGGRPAFNRTFAAVFGSALAAFIGVKPRSKCRST